MYFQAAALSTCLYLAAEAYSPVPPERDGKQESSPAAKSNCRSEKSPHKKKKATAVVENPVVEKCVEMGFLQSHVKYAMKELKMEIPRPEMVVAWLLDHPEVEVLLV